MKYFLLKQFSFLAIALIILSCLFKICLPFHYGNHQLTAKLNFLEENDFNTYFIGNSFIFRGLSPAVFDTHTQSETHTFNLASDGMRLPESYHLLEEVLSDVKFSNSTVVISFEIFDNLHDQVYRSVRAKYYTNISNYLKQLKYVLFMNKNAANFSYTERGLKRYSMNFFESLFKIGLRKDIIEFLLDSKRKKSAWVLGSNKDGFVQPMNKVTSKNMETMVENSHKVWKQVVKNNPSSANAHYLSELANGYIEMAKKNNIHLIFTIESRRYYMEDQIWIAFNQIPEKNRIALVDPEKFPQLYKVSNFLDNQFHLSHDGSQIFSKLMANEFDKLLLNQ